MTEAPITAVPRRPMAKAWTASRAILAALGIAALIYLPFLLTERAVFGVPLSNGMLLNLGITQINLMLIFMLGALSLNFLTGCAGLISIGHGAFYAVGAMTGAVVGTQWGLPLPVVLVAAALVGALAGVIAGLPSLRVRGLYFVLSTLAAHHIIIFIFQEYQFEFFDVAGVPYTNPALGPMALDTPIRWYFFLLVLVIAVYWGLSNILKSREGRAMRAMHDHELAATAMGADVRILRLKAFALSSAIAAVAGALYAYYLTNATSESFGISFAIQFIAMIIIGGLGSLPGSLFGAAIWLLLPSLISGLAANVGDAPALVRVLLVDNRAQFVQALFGSLVIVLLIFAPGGLPDLSRKLGRLFARERGQ
ncbi:branched-chain amino acid ABC transporter permease [Zhengella mangrovi]|nr:branched-chain amino acid ABC transporter permease [Zhengella mangrovi]